MKLFRRGRVWVVMTSVDEAYTFDEATGEFSPRGPLERLIGDNARLFLPVLPDEPVPRAMLDRLVLRMEPPDGK